MVEEITELPDGMPHAPGFEGIAVSGILKWPELQDELQFDEGHFHLIRNRVTFRWALELRQEGGVDFNFLLQRMAESGDMEVVGIGEIMDFQRRAFNPQQVRAVAADLRDYKGRRMAIETAASTLLAAKDTSERGNYLQCLGEPVSAIFEAATEGKAAMGTKEAVLEWLGSYERLCRGEESPKGMQTSLQRINELFGGLQQKRIVIVAGKPTAGKSVLAGQFCVDVATDGHPALYLSLEMPRLQLVGRLVTYLAHLPGIAISDPLGFAAANDRTGPSKDELQHISTSARKLSDLPLYIEDPAGASLAQVVALIRKYHRRHGIKLVALDYVQLVQGSRRKGANKEEEVAEISHALQAVAKELDLCILVLSQLNKENRTKYAEAIFEDADLMLSIILDEETNEHLGIGIKKDRHHGKTGQKIEEIRLDKTMVKFRHYHITPEP